MDYVKSTCSLPKEFTPVWVRILGGRPRKMYRVYNTFYYYNKKLHENGNYCGISEHVLWKYTNKE